MGEFLDRIPGELHKYIEAILKDVGFPEEESFRERIAECWIEKKDVFETQVAKFNLKEDVALSKNDPRGALALTCSGSLVHIGPLKAGKRSVIYSSLGFRVEQKEASRNTESVLKEDLSVDKPIVFEKGPVKKTSPVYKLASCLNSLDLAMQEDLLSQLASAVESLMLEKNRKLHQG
jgi:hypothetical protein